MSRGISNDVLLRLHDGRRVDHGVLRQHLRLRLLDPVQYGHLFLLQDRFFGARTRRKSQGKPNWAAGTCAVFTGIVQQFHVDVLKFSEPDLMTFLWLQPLCRGSGCRIFILEPHYLNGTTPGRLCRALSATWASKRRVPAVKKRSSSPPRCEWPKSALAWPPCTPSRGFPTPSSLWSAPSETGELNRIEKLVKDSHSQVISNESCSGL